MDGQAAIDNDTEVLKRIVTTLLSLAALAERVSSHPLRILVLWILRPAEAAAREFVDEIAPMRARPCFPAVRIGNSPADAMRLARSFRALAAVVGYWLDEIGHFTMRHHRVAAGAPNRDRVAAAAQNGKNCTRAIDMVLAAANERARFGLHYPTRDTS